MVILMQYKAAGDLIKSEREKRSWEQNDLAKRMSITQQTVSRWEKGESRPKYDDLLKLVDLFKGDIYEWSSKAGYELDEEDNSLAPYLPLHILTPEKFEFFCRDLIQALNPDATVHRYGNQGDNQEGIDLYAQFTKDVLDYQCRRHAQFGPADIRRVVKDVTFKAKHHHLLLSRSATAAARKEMLKNKDWTLLDREDLSAKVRTLPADVALKIVDTYFPGKRGSFLGREEESPWLTSDEFFLQYTDRKKFFSHGWNFVGRIKELDMLKEFEKQTDTQAILISGRGGIGKSRLLKAWADELSKTHPVRFLSAGSEVDPKDYALFPQGPAFLVIDDAHERADTIAILSTVARVRPEMKIIISSRPYGITRLKDELSRSGMSYDGEKTLSLNDLTVEDATALAEEVLSDPSVNGNKKYAARIAEITKDCPLATVVGSRLVGQGVINPELLQNVDRFRDELLSRFRDVIAGEIGGTNPEAIRELLDLLSSVQPFNPVDPKFQGAAEKILGKPYDKILKDISALEEAGVLLRRGRKLRVVPDLLSDYIRSFASYDEKNKKSTGYVDRVFKELQDDLATNMLINIGQLDWRLSADGVQASLLDEVWSSLKDQFKKARIYERAAILDAIKKVSYYQPTQALDLVRLALSEPTDEIEDDAKVFSFANPSYRIVVDKIPSVLRYVAYDMQYLPETLDILRQLAEKDDRPTNPHPDHPIRVMQDLASIEPRKPSTYNEAAVDHIIPWLKEPISDPFSPFDVLDVLLETEGYEDVSKGFTITMKSFKVRAEAVAGLRAKIIKEAFDVVNRKPLPEAMRALKTLGAALHYPSGILGQEITTEDRKAWDPGILDVLGGLEKVVSDTKLDPFIAVEVRGIVLWHSNYGNDATKPAAEKVINAIPDTPDYELARAIVDSWGWTFERADGRPGRDEVALVEWREKLIQKLIKEHEASFSQLVGILEERIKTLKFAKMSRHGDSGPFLGAIMEYSLEFTQTLGEHLLADPSSPLVDWFGVVASVMGKAKKPEFLPLVKRALETNNLALTQCVARSLGWGLFNTEVLPEEIEIIASLAKHEDQWIRKNIVRAVKRFPTESKTRALEILLNIKITDSKEVADEVLGEFEEKYGYFKMEELSEPQLQQIFDALAECPSIDDYQISLFLSKASFTNPLMTVQLMMKRVEYKESHPNEEFGKYDTLPYSWRRSEGLRFHETKQYEQILRIVRDWATATPENPIRFHYGADLFKSVSAGYDEVTLKVLEEWIDSANEHQLEAAAALLSEAGKVFVWDKKEFVINLLEKSQKYGDSCYKSVCSSLHSSVIAGGRSGTAGQPFPQDITQRDRSYQMMSEITPGSPAYRFYEMLYNSAKREIDLHTYDEEDFDE